MNPEKTVKSVLAMPGSPFVGLVEKISGATTLVVHLEEGVVEVRMGMVDEQAASELVGIATLITTQIVASQGSDMDPTLKEGIGLSKDGSRWQALCDAFLCASGVPISRHQRPVFKYKWELAVPVVSVIY